MSNEIVFNNATDMIVNEGVMASMFKLAELMASSKIQVPQHFRNSPADCMAVIMQAAQWKMNPFAVAQKTYDIKGKLGYEAQLVNAVITSMAPTVDRLNYEWFGPWENVIGKFDIKRGDKGEYRVPGWKMADEIGLGVKVWATMKGEEQPRILDLLLAQARTRNSGLWADDPKQQLAYLASKRWASLHCPDVVMGVYTKEELESIPDSEKDVTPPAAKANGSTLESIIEQSSKIDEDPAPQQTPEPEAQEENVNTLTGEVMKPEKPTLESLSDMVKKSPNLAAFKLAKDKIASMHGAGEISDSDGNALMKVMAETKKRLNQEAINEPLDF